VRYDEEVDEDIRALQVGLVHHEEVVDNQPSTILSMGDQEQQDSDMTDEEVVSQMDSRAMVVVDEGGWDEHDYKLSIAPMVETVVQV